MRQMQDAIRLLMNRAEDSLTLDELSTLSGTLDEARYLARNLSIVSNGIAHMVREDGEHGNAGNFQDAEDVTALLHTLGAGLDTIATMVELGQLAEERQRTIMGWDATKALEQMKQVTHSCAI